jgi:energy-coupling factor transporter ATP-binding protein EcfA2
MPFHRQTEQSMEALNFVSGRSTLLCLENCSWAYPGGGDFVLKSVNMAIAPGQCHCLTGPTGSGKTALLLAIKGLLPPGRQKGAVSFSSASIKAGIVLQNPETQILGSTIGAEVAFALENHCVDPVLMPAKVAKALSDIGLKLPLEGDTEKLSIGRKYRLILAALLVMEPGLLLLDELVAQLDQPGLEKLLTVIRRLKASGVSFLVCEHHPHPLKEVIDTFWRLQRDGSVRRLNASPPEIQWDRPYPGKSPSSNSSEKVIKVRKLAVVDENGSPVWSDVSFSVAKGRRVVIYGPNGAGKTTLLRCLNGFIRPSKGSIHIWGKSPSPARLRGRVGSLFQNPQKQLFENTVFDEVVFTLERLGGDRKSMVSRVEDALFRCGISELSGQSPYKLSYG